MADFASVLVDVQTVVWDEHGDLVQEKKVLSQMPPSFYISVLNAKTIVANRLNTVFAGRSFGDIINAITKFYEDKPLLKTNQ